MDASSEINRWRLDCWRIFILKIFRESHRQDWLRVVAGTAIHHDLAVLAANVAPMKNHLVNETGYARLLLASGLPGHPHDVPKPSLAILPGNSRGDGFDGAPQGPCHGAGVAESRLGGGAGDVHKLAICNGLSAGVGVNALPEDFGESVYGFGICIVFHSNSNFESENDTVEATPKIAKVTDRAAHERNKKGPCDWLYAGSWKVLTVAPRRGVDRPLRPAEGEVELPQRPSRGTCQRSVCLPRRFEDL